MFYSLVLITTIFSIGDNSVSVHTNVMGNYANKVVCQQALNEAKSTLENQLVDNIAPSVKVASMKYAVNGYCVFNGVGPAKQ